MPPPLHQTTSTITGVSAGAWIITNYIQNPGPLGALAVNSGGAASVTGTPIIFDTTDDSGNTSLAANAIKGVPVTGNYTIIVTPSGASLPGKSDLVAAAFDPIIGTAIVTYPNLPVNVTGTSTLDLGVSTLDHQLGTLNLPTGGATLTLANANTLQVNGVTATNAGNVISSGAGFGGSGIAPSSSITVAAGGALTVNSKLSDFANNGAGAVASSVNKAGSGTLTLAGQNTYTGPTTISAGILSIATFLNGGAAGPLGTSSNAASNLVFNGGGTLAYTGPAASTDRSFTINPGATATINVTTALTLTGTTRRHLRRPRQGRRRHPHDRRQRSLHRPHHHHAPAP